MRGSSFIGLVLLVFFITSIAVVISSDRVNDYETNEKVNLPKESLLAEETSLNLVLKWFTEKGLVFIFHIIFYSTFPLAWITFIWVFCLACRGKPSKHILKRQMAVD